MVQGGLPLLRFFRRLLALFLLHLCFLPVENVGLAVVLPVGTVGLAEVVVLAVKLTVRLAEKVALPVMLAVALPVGSEELTVGLTEEMGLAVGSVELAGNVVLA